MKSLTFIGLIVILLLQSVVQGADSLVSDSSQKNIQKQKRMLQAGEFDDYVTKYTDYRDAIMASVTTLNNLETGYPGRAVTYDENTVILAHGNQVGESLILAAQIGSGRIIVITDPYYLNNFATSTHADADIALMQANMKSWITKATSTGDSDFMTAEDYLTAVTPSNLAIYSTQTLDIDQITDADRTKIFDFVSNGGGLILAVNPDSWAPTQLTDDYTLMLTSKVFLAAGIYFVPGQIMSVQTFDLDYSESYVFHIYNQLKMASTASSALDYTGISYSVAKLIEYLPQSQKTKLQTTFLGLITQAQIDAIAPTSTNSITMPQSRLKLVFYQFIFLERKIAGRKAPQFASFPGDMAKSSPMYVSKTRGITFKSFAYEEIRHTGFYVQAGTPITITVSGTIPTQPWEVYIGIHWDNNADWMMSTEGWKRWPRVFTKSIIINGMPQTTFTMYSAFGGLLVFKSPASLTQQTLTVKVTNLYEAAIYYSQSTLNKADWTRRVDASAPWGCAIGAYVGFCLPSVQLDNNNIFNILSFYDSLHRNSHFLRGTNEATSRRTFIVGDVSPSNGNFVHGGFPIVLSMTALDPSQSSSYLFKVPTFGLGASVSNNLWYLLSEWGRNFRRDWWTYTGSYDVTNVVFALHNVFTVYGQRPRNNNFVYPSTTGPNNGIDFLQSPNWMRWRSDYKIGVRVYIQVIQDFGWNCLKRVFLWYEKEPVANLPTTSQARLDKFWGKWSEQVSKDLGPLLDMWGVQYSADFDTMANGYSNWVKRVQTYPRNN